MISPHEVLGVSPGASAEEVKAAYRRLVKLYHPDVNKAPDAEQQFRKVTEAYEALTNPQPRGPSFSSRTWDDVFSNFDEIFRQQQARNRDALLNFGITLEQAFHGADISVTGVNGEVHNVKVPRGTQQGDRVVIRGAGMHAFNNTPPGNLIVQFILVDHPVFKRGGANLFTTVEVDALKAVVGTSTRLTLIDGLEIDVSIPQGVKTGARLRVVGGGMPLGGDVSQRGDLYVEVLLFAPEVLDESHCDVVVRLQAMLRDRSTQA